MELENAVLILMGSFFIIFPLERIMRVFFEKRTSSTPFMVVTYLFYPLSMTIARVLIRLPVVTMLTLALALLVMSLNYKASWLKRITTIVSIFAFGLILEFSIVTLYGFYLSSLFVFTEVLDIMTVVSVVSVFFLAALLLQNFKNIKKDIVVLPMFLVSAFVIPILSIVLAAIVVSSADISTFFMFLAIAIILGVDVLAFYLFDRLTAAHEHRLKSALHAQEKEYYLTQCRLMQESAGRVRSSRHDMKIHMAALKSFIAEGKTDSAAEYIDSFLGDIGESRPFSQTDCLALDSVINYKLRDIQNTDIRLALRLRVPPVLEIADADIVTIIGNLLDNALEAVAKTPPPAQKTLKLSVALDNEVLVIKTENTFNGEIREVAGQTLASLKDGSDHGHGLKNVKRSVDKYGGSMKSAHASGVFSVSILLYENGGERKSTTGW